MDVSLLNKIEACQEEMKAAKFSIALDWLALYFTQPGLFRSEGIEEGDSIIINEDLYLLAIDKPTLHFLDHFEIIYKKERCGHVLVNPRSERFFKKDKVKVEFANHTLYSGVWMNVLDGLTGWGLVYHGANRVDICIDNVGYLQQMLNIYAKQSVENRTLVLKNSSAKRSIFSAKVLDPQSMDFQNFNIGSMGGNKFITVYNKTLELTKSGKKYIMEYWKRNGIIDEIPDLTQMAAVAKDDDVKVWGYKNIYRFELRLKSESIKEIKGFSLNMLKTGAGLASIVKLHTKKYFEGLLNDSQNISRCTPVPLLPFEKLSALDIEKIERQKPDGVYKAKLTVHGIIIDLHKGYIEEGAVKQSVKTLIDRIKFYELQQYFNNHIKAWRNEYILNTDPEHVPKVSILMNRIEKQVAEITYQSDPGLGLRNNQPGATASFGEGV